MVSDDGRNVDGSGRQVSWGGDMAQRLHSMSVKAWKTMRGAMKWMWGSDKCSERTRRGRAQRDDTGTRVEAETWDVTDSEAGSQGGIEMGTVSEEPCVYSTANRANTYSAPHWQQHDADRTTAEST